MLVVGGGLAGLTAARTAADLGHPVVVVEKAAALGGSLAAVEGLVPDRPPYDSLHDNHLPRLIAELSSHAGVRIFVSSTVKTITGQPGQFHVELATPAGEVALTAGAIVQATGSRPYDASKLGHLGYGSSPNVITAPELDAMLAGGGLKRPSDGAVPQRVVFIQCAGSRDPEHLPYCSADCCSATLRQVATIHRAHPDVETAVVYRDMRTPGQLERFYLAVQQQPGSLFARGEVAGVSGNGHLQVALRDTLLGEGTVLDADLVVLAVGLVPNSADGEAIRIHTDAVKRSQTGESEVQREEARKVAAQYAGYQGTEILNLDYRQGPDLPTLRYGFPDSHFICFPYETRRTGIYAAGTVHAPMDAGQAEEDGAGAAMKAVQCIVAAARGEAVHPRCRRHRHPRLLPATLHPVQALHRGVSVRHPQRGRKGHAAAQRAALPAVRDLHGRLSGADHLLPRLLGRRRGQHDQGDERPGGVRGEAAHPRPALRERRPVPRSTSRRLSG